jgi:diaminohydroxyphosphoribosylaminopyrimidine deaminase/5-amino-6-(5-phosphoribosylamino)uracil reductase
MSAFNHHHYMSLALQLAQQGRTTVSPNPMVGCVIVKNNGIVGQGFHQAAGQPHAEVNALQAAQTNAQGATAYITLEPCCHQGRTPPCTKALVQAGIKKVFVACLDPNPLVAGKGIEILRSAGMAVELGLCEAEATRLNEFFFHYIRCKRPFVIAKWAMSLDGKTTTHQQDSRHISCAESQAFSHQTRQQVDAILIGAKTAMQDNPLLTVRLTTNETVPKHPTRIVLTTQGKLPLHLKIFDLLSPAKTIVATTNAVDKRWCAQLKERHIEVLILEKNKQVDLPALLDELGKREITSLLVEGGMQVHEAFFQNNLVNQIHVYLAPTIIGTLEKKHTLTSLHQTQIGRDIYFTANY